MRRLQLIIIIGVLLTLGCGGSQAADSSHSEPGSGDPTRDDEFRLSNSDTAGEARGERPSEIEATPTEAAMRLFMVNPDTGPIQGIVIKMTAPDGTIYYTAETDSHGYAEVLVPIGQRYEMEYLSLGRQRTSATVVVEPEPNQDIRLTMRYRQRREAPTAAPPPQPTRPTQPTQGEAEPETEPEPQGFVLEGILFEAASATIQAESHARLDRVVEYLTHRVSTRIRISGHTDNVGSSRSNQSLSEERAETVRAYLIANGIDEDRVEAVGYGDQHPVASNDTDEGRQQNRRIEAAEL